MIAVTSNVSGTISVTKAQLTTLIANNQLIPGAFYKISTIDPTTFGTGVVAIIQATATNKIADIGQARFFDAPYNSVGGTNLGLWNVGLLPAINNITIWNNLVWKNLTGANGATNPSLDAVNWLVQTASVANGYVEVWNFIEYDLGNDVIKKRIDFRNNEVENDSTKSMNQFRWGDNTCTNNKIYNESVLINRNCTTNASTTNNNIFADTSNFQIDTQTGNFNNNEFYTTINNAGTNSYATFTGNTFKKCTFVNSTTFSFTNSYFLDCSFGLMQGCFFNDCNAFQSTFAGCNGANAFGFFRCNFQNFTRSFPLIFTTNFSNTTFTQNELLIQMTITFTGGAGAGAVGAVTLPQGFFIPQNYFFNQIIVDVSTALVGVGATLNFGHNFSATAGFNGTTIITLNNAGLPIILAPNTTAKSSITPSGLTMAVNVAAITAGVLNMYVKFVIAQ